MYLKRLLLRNFRNYLQTEVVFSDGINLILGENGQGKTNLLEAIHFVSTGRSFRASALSDLICFGESFFYLEAEFYKDGVGQLIKIYYDDVKRKVQYNQKIYPTLTSLLGVLPSTFLCPNDLSLISGNPAHRRRFLDLHIAQSDPLYLNHLGRYFKSIKQRNHLLRSKSTLAMAPWEEVMAQSASYLMFKRNLAIKALNTSCSKWIEILSKGLDRMGLHYLPSLPASDHKTWHPAALQRAWEKNRSRDMMLGSTQIGPHRDDMQIQLDGRPAKLFSSEGQKRSCISCLRFGQWEQMAETLNHPPLLGIDDFGIQLDQERTAQLNTHLPQFKQVFLASPQLMQNNAWQGVPLRSFLVRQGCINVLEIGSPQGEQLAVDRLALP